MNNAEVDGFSPFDRRVLDPVCFKLLGESHAQTDVGLGVGGITGVWEARKVVGH